MVTFLQKLHQMKIRGTKFHHCRREENFVRLPKGTVFRSITNKSQQISAVIPRLSTEYTPLGSTVGHAAQDCLLYPSENTITNKQPHTTANNTTIVLSSRMKPTSKNNLWYRNKRYERSIATTWSVIWKLLDDVTALLLQLSNKLKDLQRIYSNLQWQHQAAWGCQEEPCRTHLLFYYRMKKELIKSTKQYCNSDKWLFIIMYVASQLITELSHVILLNYILFFFFMQLVVKI